MEQFGFKEILIPANEPFTTALVTAKEGLLAGIKITKNHWEKTEGGASFDAKRAAGKVMGGRSGRNESW